MAPVVDFGALYGGEHGTHILLRLDTREQLIVAHTAELVEGGASAGHVPVTVRGVEQIGLGAHPVRGVRLGRRGGGQCFETLDLLIGQLELLTGSQQHGRRMASATTTTAGARGGTTTTCTRSRLHLRATSRPRSRRHGGARTRCRSLRGRRLRRQQRRNERAHHEHERIGTGL